MPSDTISAAIAIATGAAVGGLAFGLQESARRMRVRAAAHQATPASAEPPPTMVSEPPTPPAARPRKKRPASAGSATPRVRKGTATERAARVRKRQEAADRALAAVTTFVEGPARRARATACADVLVLAVPATERGKALSRFLRAVGAKEGPTRLQQLAAEAGIELTAWRQDLEADPGAEVSG